MTGRARPDAAGNARNGYFVVDPAVELLRAGPGTTVAIHPRWQTAVVLPNVPGLDGFLRSFTRPRLQSTFQTAWDDPREGALALDGLLFHGLAFGPFERARCDAAALARARARWLRQRLASQGADRECDLRSAADLVGLATSAAAAAMTGAPAPDLRLRNVDLTRDHAALEALGTLRRAGPWAFRRVELYVQGGAVNAALARELRALDARVHVTLGRGAMRPAPTGRATERLLEALCAHGVETIAHVPLVLATDALAAWTRRAHWLREQRVQGVTARLDPRAAGARAAGPEHEALRAALRALAREHTDASVGGLAGDVHIAGLRLDPTAITSGSERAADVAPAPADRSALGALRADHLRRRVRALTRWERECRNPQTLDAERQLLHEDQVSLLAAMLGLHEGHVLLDLCGGIGRYARRFSPFVGAAGAVVVIDRDAVSLEQGRALARQRGAHNVAFRAGDACDLRLPDRFADAVCMSGAVEHFIALGRGRTLAREIARVLRPGGRVLIDNPVALVRLRPALDVTVLNQSFFTDVERVLGAAGLRVEQCRLLGTPLALGAAGRLDRVSEQVPRLLPRLLPPAVDAVLPNAPHAGYVSLFLIAHRA